MIRISCAVGLAALAASAEGATGAAILAHPASVRQAGAAGASLAGPADVLAGAANPAALDRLSRRGEASLGGESLPLEGESNLVAGVAYAIRPEWTVGVLGSWYSIGVEEVTPTGELRGVTTESWTYALALAGAYRTGIVSLGASVKRIGDHVAGDSAGEFAVDAGVLVNLEPFLLGGAVRNLGPAIRSVEGVSDDLPRAFRISAAWAPAAPAVSVGADADVISDGQSLVSAGASWRPINRLALRAGVGIPVKVSVRIAGGLSVALGRGMLLDYAVQVREEGFTHSGAISLAFGSRVPTP